MKKTFLTVWSMLCLTAMLFGCSAQHNPSVSPDTDTGEESRFVISDTHATGETNALPTENDVLSDKNYLIQLCSFSDSISGVSHKAEYHDWREGSFVAEEEAKKIKLPIGDDDYQAEYWKTEKRFLEFYYTHSYWDEKGDSFSVTEDGQLSLYFFGSSDDADENGKIYTEAECREIARAFLDNIVDADDYTVQSEYDAGNQRYKISFTKTVSGLDCADQAKFLVEENGHIYSFSSFMLGQIPNDAAVDFDIQAVETQLVARLDQIYADAKVGYDDVRYDFLNHTVTRDANGEYFLVSTVEVRCIIDHGEVLESMAERLSFVVTEN